MKSTEKTSETIERLEDHSVFHGMKRPRGKEGINIMDDVFKKYYCVSLSTKIKIAKSIGRRQGGFINEPNANAPIGKEHHEKQEDNNVGK